MNSKIHDKFRTSASVTLGALALAMTSSVSADPIGTQVCNGAGEENVCILITPSDPGFWDIHVGIDVPMTRARAEQLLACSGGNPFYAELWGNDDNDQDIAVLPISAGWPRAGDRGLSAEFDLRAHSRVLDEDPGSDRDEVFARIYLYDCSQREYRYDSDTIEHQF